MNLILLGLFGAALPGCYQRPQAPPLEYSSEQVQTLRDEIESMDWE